VTDLASLSPAELFQLGRRVDRIIESSEHHANNYYDFQNGVEYAATLAAVLHELVDMGDVIQLMIGRLPSAGRALQRVSTVPARPGDASSGLGLLLRCAE
jgi:hypothetical protein